MTAKNDDLESERPEPVTLLVSGIVPKSPLAIRLSRPTLALTLETSTLEVSVSKGGEARRVVLDRTGCLLAPRGSSLTLRARSPGNRVALLGFDDELVANVAKRYGELGLERERLEGWLTRIELLSRTVWVHEIVHRYVFERHALGKHDNLATRFLAVEIVKEIYFLLRDREDGADRASAGQRYSPVVERAVAWIEAHIFEAGGAGELARRSGASESTLLRSFRRELGCTPGEFWRTRRLDEAVVLLRLGRYSVAEVASLAGYDNATSFGFAFRKRFGSPPSSFRRRRATRRAP